jgi:hypothetical protein
MLNSAALDSQENGEIMTKAKLFYLAFATGAMVICSHSVFAGGLSEGGGKSVVCRNQSGAIESADTLDLFESNQLRGIEFDKTMLGTDEWATVQNVLKRLESWDKFRANLYKLQLASFPKEVRFIAGAKLVPVDDANNVIIPIGCALGQAAIQRAPEFSGDARYLIDKSIWTALSVGGRASLLLHEIVYRETRSTGQQNSIKARYFNSMMTSTAAREFGKEDYQKIRAAAQLKSGIYAKINSRQLFLIRAFDNSCRKIGLQMAIFNSEDLPGTGLDKAVENELGSERILGRYHFMSSVGYLSDGHGEYGASLPESPSPYPGMPPISRRQPLSAYLICN